MQIAEGRMQKEEEDLGRTIAQRRHSAMRSLRCAAQGGLFASPEERLRSGWRRQVR